MGWLQVKGFANCLKQLVGDLEDQLMRFLKGYFSLQGVWHLSNAELSRKLHQHSKVVSSGAWSYTFDMPKVFIVHHNDQILFGDQFSGDVARGAIRRRQTFFFDDFLDTTVDGARGFSSKATGTLDLQLIDQTRFLSMV